ncbi:MAG TPA: AI-2E family transporter [Gammaproteobacteria bacterium]|nr:AI-2E family transporter [Gammaproteobacteria bacterium]
MLAQIRGWYERNFSDPQVVILAILLIVGSLVVLLFGRMLAPVLASVIIAYLLEAVVQRLERLGLPRLPSVLFVFVVFLAALMLVLFGITPMITRQLAQVVQALPAYIRGIQDMLVQLPDRYPQVVSEEQVQRVVDNLGAELLSYGSQLVSVSGVMNLVALLIFLVLMPILVFFFLKDKGVIMGWITSYLPRDRHLATSVWHEVDAQIGNYIRGKVLEILIVWIVTYIVFSLLGLQFAMLLSMIVGFSVVIPYIGAAVVTIPVALVALFQFGVSAEFAWVLIAYAIIQALDGNVLVPILFSEVVSLHPVAIILAVLVFGGIWGFWGVFFAIPLATLVNAALRAWPRAPAREQAEMKAAHD